jgi:hypothetical protein
MGVHIEAVGKFAKDHGQSPPSSLSPRSRKLLDKAEGVVLTKEQKEALATQGLVGLFQRLDRLVSANKRRKAVPTGVQKKAGSHRTRSALR